ncbi:MAG: hypothetical protein ACKPKO_20860, partial [Candidatus Fonsibacter sp.]
GRRKSPAPGASQKLAFQSQEGAAGCDDSYPGGNCLPSQRNRRLADVQVTRYAPEYPGNGQSGGEGGNSIKSSSEGHAAKQSSSGLQACAT